MLAAIDKPFIPPWSELRAFAPELCLIATIVAVLLAPFFTPKRSNIPSAIVALLGLIIALGSAVLIGFTDAGVAGEHFRGLLVADPMSLLWKVLLLLFTIGVIFMWFS